MCRDSLIVVVIPNLSVHSEEEAAGELGQGRTEKIMSGHQTGHALSVPLPCFLVLPLSVELHNVELMIDPLSEDSASPLHSPALCYKSQRLDLEV